MSDKASIVYRLFIIHNISLNDEQRRFPKTRVQNKISAE